jgi:hypothetical protein
MSKEIKSKIVFCHLDTNNGNWLITPSKHKFERVHIIDYEACNYGHRGYDIGHHFKNRQTEFESFLEKGVKDLPHIPYPTEEERRFFIRKYLDETKKYCKNFGEALDNEESVLIEAELYGGISLMSHIAFFISNPQVLVKIGFPAYCGILIGWMVKDFQERKERITKMYARFPTKNKK